MKRLTVTLAALTLMTGCGMASQEVAQSFGIQSVSPLEAPFANGPLALYLGVTPEQRSAIRAVVKATRNQAPHRGELKRMLLAKTVDSAQLEAFVQARLSERQQMIGRAVPALSQIRDILTADQRAKLQALNPESGPVAWAIQARAGEGPLKPLLVGITLNAEQQAAADALKAELVARRGDRQAVRKGLVTFMADGNTEALKHVLETYQPNPPVAAIARLANALDQSQRQQIADRIERHLAH